jgi:sulfoxide reductase heme-binding subunit YedZ
MVSRLWQRVTALLAAVTSWRFFKPAAFVACFAPGAWLGYRAWRFFLAGDFLALGPDPAKTLEHETGLTALAILFITLSITPLRRIAKVNRLQAVRRMLGLWSFTYAFVHLSMWLVLDQLCYSVATCDFAMIKADILKRRFILMGMLAFTLMVPLALTSTAGWVRRLKKNWQRLHRLVYGAAAAAVIHFVWIQKSDIRVPLRYAVLFAVLMAARVAFAWQRRTARGGSGSARGGAV